jgi:hypothetical protein
MESVMSIYYFDLRDGFAFLPENLDTIDGKKELKAWRKTNSDRVKGLVAHDSQSDLTTASLQSKVDALTQTQELQLSILTRLDKVTSNPQVKIILAVMATAAMSWAASKGLK